jgi:hypothetical protein
MVETKSYSVAFPTSAGATITKDYAASGSVYISYAPAGTLIFRPG